MLGDQAAPRTSAGPPPPSSGSLLTRTLRTAAHARPAATLTARRAALAALAVALALALAASSAPAGAAPLRYSNPLRDAVTHAPLSCPDPSVLSNLGRADRYLLFCTSDNARNAFPIWRSPDLVHWYPAGSVFPHGRQPAWAMPSDGHSRTGLFWAPAIYRIDGRLTLYFAAVYNPASHAAGSAVLKPGTMVLGVATATSPGGPWHSQLLHYPGELNAENPVVDQEASGGDIDPAVVLNPQTGQRYLFWAEQREQIWDSQLSANGLSVGPTLQLAVTVSEPWECDPISDECTVEGPEALYHDGAVWVFYSGASTWDGSYAVGAAHAAQALNPADPFVKDPAPILRSGDGFLGPGGVSDPVTAPNGQTAILFHALTHVPTSHASSQRLLMLGTLTWIDGQPLINHGVA